ncbi:hypothetical protein FA403_30945, partial [Pseudomonas aeruginosa]|nr:hypothetical protein [Pseudomonas aeruginosa]
KKWGAQHPGTDRSVEGGVYGAVTDKREREANRGVRKTMKECIKPENVIDDDVKECMEGLRVKEW